MDFVEYGLLYCVFCGAVKYTSSTILDLHNPHTLAANVLTESVVELAPKGFIFFPFVNGKDVPFCVFVFLVLRCF
jgi:hypothetical protein